MTSVEESESLKEDIVGNGIIFQAQSPLHNPLTLISICVNCFVLYCCKLEFVNKQKIYIFISVI